mmetsp:Transcript_3642/g.7601  ORF Transcript_3642/g.7601 Transcript_3642/m.7601 type:complete len:115 (-) Transcript_3642:4312-4656(-)
MGIVECLPFVSLRKKRRCSGKVTTQRDVSTQHHDEGTMKRQVDYRKCANNGMPKRPKRPKGIKEDNTMAPFLIFFQIPPTQTMWQVEISILESETWNYFDDFLSLPFRLMLKSH